MRIPIRYQFMLPLLAVALASLAAISAVHARLATVRTRDRVEQQLQGVAGVLAESSFPLTNPVLQQMGELANTEFVLTDNAGNLLAASGQQITLPDNLPVNQPPADRAADVSLGSVLAFGDDWFYYSSLRLSDRRGAGRPSVLHILFPQNEYNVAWRALFLPPLLVGIAAIIGVMVTTQLVASRINRVLRRLSGDVKRLAAGDFSEVASPEWDDETKDLAVAINQTATQLAAYEAETRRTEQMRTLAVLGSGVAHEMRNAATGCRMAIDLHDEACKGTHADDDTLQMAKQQLSLMERRLQTFLRLGKQPNRDNEQDVKLANLISDLVMLVEPSASHQGVVVAWGGGVPDAVVHADPEQLSQAIMNLLLNSLDAAGKQSTLIGKQGHIRIELEAADGMALLTVADSGDGPPASLADTLFEPFVSDKPEGIGVGLTVTQQVASNNGGSVEWQRVAGETQFTLRLPLATSLPTTKSGVACV